MTTGDFGVKNNAVGGSVCFQEQFSILKYEGDKAIHEDNKILSIHHMTQRDG